MDFLLACESKLLSPATIDFYRRMLTPFVDSTGDDLTAANVRAFLAGRAHEVSPATVHAHARAIRAFVRFAYRERWLQEPVEFEMPRQEQRAMEVLTPDEIRRLLHVCGLRDRAFVLVLLDSGVRRNEALGLTWEDIDLDSGAIVVRRGKGGKGRMVYVGVETRRTLLRYRRQSACAKPFPWTPSGIATRMATLGNRAGVQVSCHKCRRTFATMCIRNGMNPFTLQVALGHSSLDMTRRYAALVSADVQKAHREAQPVDSLLRQ